LKSHTPQHGFFDRLGAVSSTLQETIALMNFLHVLQCIARQIIAQKEADPKTNERFREDPLEYSD